MPLDPKKDFCADETARKTWFEISGSALFRKAVGAAMLQTQQHMSAPPDLASAASYAYRLEGAKQFANILMSLADPESKLPTKPASNLRHE